MTTPTDIHIPRETVNDDFVTIVAWQTKNGGKVSSGQALVSIETSKAIIEIDAEVDGYLEILHADEADVAVGEMIGRIHEQADFSTTKPVTESAPSSSMTTSISRKAQVLLDEHGIDTGVFAGQGLIRETDVIRYLGAKAETKAATPEPAIAADTILGTRDSQTTTTPRTKLGLLGDARVSARERGKGVIALAWDYFWRNWLLGHLVRFAPRGVDLFLHRARGVKMGKDCFIDPSVTLETAYPENITLGDDVRITAGAIIMTHIKAPHYLRDSGIMPAVLKPVVLEDHCFIGLNSVIIPGVRVGEAAVVASGAVVVNNVPPYTMVAGNPAKIIKRFPNPKEQEPSG